MKQVNPSSFFSIFPEIDKKDALLHFDNNFNTFFSILEKYCADGRQNIARITDAFCKRNYSDYIILVHALKSTSATIGNHSLSLHAKEHEFAGKDGNYDLIERDFDNLITEYADFTNKLEAFMSTNCEVAASANSNSENRPEIDEFTLDCKIKETVLAIDDFEIDKAADILNELMEYNLTDSCYECISEGLRYIEEYEYDKAIETLNSLLQ